MVPAQLAGHFAYNKNIGIYLIMEKFANSVLFIIRASLLVSVSFIFGCASAENTAKSWVGQPIQRLMNVPGPNVEKAYLQENGNAIYVSSDYSQSECKTYWEVDDKGIIVSFHRERGSWKCD
jgi:hypothetical protein